MKRETSITAYKQIQEEGLLPKMRLRVYEYLYKNGPATGKQMDMALNPNGIRGNGTFTGRLSELERCGVISVVGKTVCEHTGRTVLLWDVTSKLPNKPSKDKILTRSELIHMNQDLISIIVSAIVYLRRDDNNYYANILQEKYDEVSKKYGVI